MNQKYNAKNLNNTLLIKHILLFQTKTERGSLSSLMNMCKKFERKLFVRYVTSVKQLKECFFPVDSAPDKVRP